MPNLITGPQHERIRATLPVETAVQVVEDAVLVATGQCEAFYYDGETDHPCVGVAGHTYEHRFWAVDGRRCRDTDPVSDTRCNLPRDHAGAHHQTRSTTARRYVAPQPRRCPSWWLNDQCVLPEGHADVHRGR